MLRLYTLKSFSFCQTMATCDGLNFKTPRIYCIGCSTRLSAIMASTVSTSVTTEQEPVSTLDGSIQKPPPLQVAKRLEKFKTTIFTQMSSLAIKHGAINLGQGFPNFDGPEFVKEAAIQAIRDGEMKVIRRLLSVNGDLSSLFQRSLVIRNFSTSPISDDNYNFGSSESLDFEQFIGQKNGPHMNSFYRKLDKAEKSYDRNGVGSNFNGGARFGHLDGLNDGFSTLNDGMSHKLKQAATYFEHDPVEVNQESYAFRPDVNLLSGMTYDTKDLDLKKPGVRRPGKRNKFETTTEEVLRKADFRNVRFLANFLTEAGIIIKRSKTGISAKAQRKIAREIKTARAFGLMPFTTMGTKQFTFGRTMEDEDADFGYEIYEHDFVENDSQET